MWAVSHTTETLLGFLSVFLFWCSVLLQKVEDMEEYSTPKDQDEKEKSKQVIERKRPGQIPEGMRACKID